MSTAFKVVIALVLITTIFCKYEKFQMSQDRGAACLDGSPPIVFIDEGKGANKEKFMVWMIGGGTCLGLSLNQTLQDCYRRSFSQLGSSTFYNDTVDVDDNGYLSTLPQINPIFYDWTKVLVQYCDGAFHISHRDLPFNYKGKDLFLRGADNIIETFRFLQEKYDFYNKDTIVLTGISAGGMGSTYWANYLHQRTKTSKIYNLPDSPLYPFEVAPAFVQAYEQFVALAISEQKLPSIIKQCMIVLRKPFAACLDITNLVQFLKMPTLVVQSSYDPTLPFYFTLGQIKCITSDGFLQTLQYCSDEERRIIEQIRIVAVNSLIKISKTRNDIGVWAPTCVQHGYLLYSFFNQPIARMGQTLTSAQAVKQFLQNPSNVQSNIVTDPWLANIRCSGANFTSVQQQQSIYRQFYYWRREAIGKISPL